MGAANFQEPRELGPYRLVARLGGSICQGFHRSSRQRCAIKVLPPAVMADEAYVQRARAEVRSASQLRHPNIVELSDVGEEGGLLFVVTAFCDTTVQPNRRFSGWH